MFKGIVKLLKNLGNFIQAKVEQVFKRFGKDATGKTIQSLRQATEIDIERGFEIDLIGDKVFEYIEDGRPPNSKFPPQGVLIDWMQSRGIAIENEFIIRRAIAINGIRPTPVIETAFIEVVQDFNKVIAPQLINAVVLNIKEAIKRGFKFGND